MQIAAASTPCNTVEQGVTRVLRQGCSAIACGAAGVISAVATLCLLPASKQPPSSADLLFLLAALALFVLCICSCRRTVAAAATLWIVLLALLTLAALAFTKTAQGSSGLTYTTPTATHILNPTSMLLVALAVVLLFSQIAGRLARANACSCD